MTKRQKQDIARYEFIKNHFDSNMIVENFNNHDLVIRTNNPDFPYVHITVAAWTDREVTPYINLTDNNSFTIMNQMSDMVF